jgi:hypothetical protein
MAKNPYFKYQSSEPRLIEDLVIESIKMMGDDYIYITRTAFDRDYLFGEDINSKFQNSNVIEMYLKSYERNEGVEIFSKFGLELKDKMTLIVSKKRFEEEITKNFSEVLRPREGDIIYSPITMELYEIEFVENEVPFYQGNKNYVYEITAQTFQYNQEQLETGMDNIDDIETDTRDLLTYIDISGLTGEFLIDEEVYVGGSLSTATFTGVVNNWSELKPNLLYLKSVEGNVSSIINSTIKGNESGAQAVVSANRGNTMDHITTYVYDNNDEIRRESRTIIDFSEVDPFSEGNY